MNPPPEPSRSSSAACADSIRDAAPGAAMRNGTRRRARMLLALALLATLSACGQKGDLYLPDEDTDRETTDEQGAGS